MSSLLFTFQDKDERGAFLDLLIQVRDDARSSEDSKTALTLQSALEKVKYDPTVTDPSKRPVALFVSGAKIKEGPYDTIMADFRQQTVGHKASVDIREMRDGKWHVVRRRQRQ